MFPEGTTTDGRSLRTFHGRLLSAAIDSEVKLQPVAIRYLREGEIDALAPFIGDDDLLSHLMRLFSNDRGDVEDSPAQADCLSGPGACGIGVRSAAGGAEGVVWRGGETG
jgi:hypothetical protein